MVYKPGQIWACVTYVTIEEGAPLWTLVELLHPPLPWHPSSTRTQQWVCVYHHEGKTGTKVLYLPTARTREERRTFVLVCDT